MWRVDVEVSSAVQVTLVALMAVHAHRRTLTLLVAQLLKPLTAPAAWRHRQGHHRCQPHHVQCRCQVQLLHQLLHQPLLPLLRPLLCPVVEDARLTVTPCALTEVTALALSAAWMVQPVHLHQTPSIHVSCPNQSTALDDHQLSPWHKYGISMASAQA